MWKSCRNIASAILGVMVLFCLTGCQGSAPREAYVRDGVEYGVTPGLFNERWWNYYERGRSFAQGGFWEEARDDYRAALALRARDRWRARTYGMHFLDYFPQRELAVALLQLGEVEEAIPHLESSLESAWSDRAAHYLNEARARLQERAGDSAPPSVELALGSDPVTNNPDLLLRGAFTDEGGVRAGWVHNRPVFVDVAEETVPFERSLRLSPGMNALVLSATDLAGNVVRETLDVALDPAGPAVSVEETPDGWVATVADDYGIREVRLGEAVLWTGEETSVRVPLPAGYHRSVPLRARDRAGNETVLVEASLRKGRPRGESSGGVRVAAATDAVPLGAGPRVSLTIADPPVETVLDYAALTLVVRTDLPVARVIVNGTPLRDLPAASFLSVGHVVPLRMGKNEITATALTVTGKRAVAKCTITRKPRLFDYPETKYRASVVSVTGTPTDQLQAFHRRFESAFVEAERFVLLDRSLIPAAMLERLLEEFGLPASATETRAEPFRTAELLIGFQAYRVYDSPDPEANGTEYVAKVVERDSLQVLSLREVFVPSHNRQSLRMHGARLAALVMEAFPRIDGKLTRTAGGGLVMNRGTEDGIHGIMKTVAIGEDADGFHLFVPAGIGRMADHRCEILPDDKERAARLRDGDPIITK